MKKNLFSLILTLTVSLVSVSNSVQASNFPDVNGSTTLYEDGIEYLSSKNIVQGYSDGNFAPKKTLNRAEMLKFVVEAKIIADGSDPVLLEAYANDRRCFLDVPVDEWYTKYICYAKAEGWVEGYESGTIYLPNQTVNFVEGLKMTMEAFDIDHPNYPTWYEGIVRGASEKNYIPFTIKDFNSGLLRDEMADLIARVLKDKKGVLNEYLGERSTVVVTFENILMGVDSTQKKKIVDKEISNDDVKWVGKTTPRDNNADISNYELWRISEGKEDLVEEFRLFACSSVDWKLSEQGGVSLRYATSPCVDFAENTDISYDNEGKESLRITQISNKAYEFSFQKNDLAEYKVNLITQGKCEGDIPNSIENPVLPTVLLKGLKLTSTENEEEFTLDVAKEAKCDQFDGMIINPAITVSIVDLNNIEFTLPNSKKGTISLNSTNVPEVIFQ